jgi:hypothetical protein
MTTTLLKIKTRYFKFKTCVPRSDQTQNHSEIGSHNAKNKLRCLVFQFLENRNRYNRRITRGKYYRLMGGDNILDGN